MKNGVTGLFAAMWVGVVLTAGASGGRDAQGVAPACQRTCPDAARFPVEAAACVAEIAGCQTKLGLYETYMAQLNAGTTRRSLPAAYIEVLQPLYPGTPLGNYRFGFSPRQPAVATTDCSMTYYTTQSYVDKLAGGTLTTPGELRLLFHELQHFRQCMQAGGRGQYARMWFDQIPLNQLQTFNMQVIHDAMPMEAEARATQDSVFASVAETNRDASGRLVRSLRAVLKRGAETVGTTMTATAGEPIALTAELTGGSQPIRTLWQIRYSTGARAEIGTRDSRTLSYTPGGPGSFEILFDAFQEGTGLRDSRRVATSVQAPRTVALPAPGIAGNVAVARGTLNVTLRNSRGAVVRGVVCAGDAAGSTRFGQQPTTAEGLASFQLTPGLSIVVSATAPGYIGASRTVTTSSSTTSLAITMVPGVGGTVCR
jgi:hypothetical protein